MVKRRSFFDGEKVLKVVDKATKKALDKFGAFVRRSAKSSLRMARYQKMSEMTQDEKADFKRRKAIAKRTGKKAKRRRVSADPGKPPRIHYKSSPLKKLIYFATNMKDRTVYVGPLDFKGKQGASKLEHGKGKYHKFPFMAPSLIKHQDQLPKLWRNAVKK